MSHKLYLSYAHADERWAHELAHQLTAAGYDVSDRLESAEILLVVTTSTGVQAAGVLSDLEACLALEKPILSLLPPEVPPDMNWLPFQFATLPYLDFAHTDAYSQLLTRLGEPPRQMVIREPRETDRPTFWQRIPLGLVGIIILGLALAAALTLPAETTIPRFIGIGLLGFILVGLVVLVWGAVQRSRWESHQQPHLPPAYLEIIQSPRQQGKKWRIRTLHTFMGSQADDHLCFRLEGIQPTQCTLYYDAHDQLFYLETPYSRQEALTTRHDSLLEPHQPLALQNGDLITLNEQVVLQFRLGKITQS